jgi:hypothetical protein
MAFLHFQKFNPVTADLDLSIQAAQVLVQAVLPQPEQVPGPEGLLGQGGVNEALHEARGVLRGVAPVARRDLTAPDHALARVPGSTGRPLSMSRIRTPGTGRPTGVMAPSGNSPSTLYQWEMITVSVVP